MVKGFTPKEQEVLRRKLLDEAYRLFSTQGYAKTSVEEIARAVGIAKGSFYHFFASKEHLVWELNKLGDEEARAKVESLLARLDEDPEEAIKDALRAVFAYYADPIYNKLQSTGDFHRLVRAFSDEQFKEHRDAVIRPLLPLLARAQQKRLIIKGDSYLIACSFLCIGLLSLHQREIGADIYPQAIEQLISLVARGLMRRPRE